jgi:hypothetical protein
VRRAGATRHPPRTPTTSTLAPTERGGAAAPDGSADTDGSLSAVDAGASSDDATPGAEGLAGNPDSGSGADAAGTGGTPSVGGLFQQPEPWTENVAALAKSTQSDLIIAALKSSGGWGGGVLQIDFSIPLFFGNTATPRQTITAPAKGSYCYGGPDCDPVPLQISPLVPSFTSLGNLAGWSLAERAW